MGRDVKEGDGRRKAQGQLLDAAENIFQLHGKILLCWHLWLVWRVSNVVLHLTGGCSRPCSSRGWCDCSALHCSLSMLSSGHGAAAGQAY